MSRFITCVFLFSATLLAGQCPNDNVFWTEMEAGHLETDVVDDVKAGEYCTLYVWQGASYTFTTCPATYDTQITVYRESGEFEAYNDDSGCDVGSEIINYIPSFSGWIRILIDKYNCQSLDENTLLSVANNGMPQDLTLTDAFGDGWNGAEILISDNQGLLLWSGTLEDGDSESFGLCLPYGCVTIETTAGDYPAEIWWTLSGIGMTSVAGGAPGQWEAGIGGVCDDGCQDPEACNFSVYATADSDACCFTNCVKMVQFDTYGDGWNNAEFFVYDWNGNLIGVETMEEGSVATDWLCLDAGCYTYEITGGDFGSEISWVLEGVHGGAISGAAPEIGSFKVGATVWGCADPDSEFYDPEANCDDGSCINGIGIEESGSNDLIIYPNPVIGGNLTVSWSGLTPDIITLYSVEGKKVADWIPSENNTMVLSVDLMQGLFLLQIWQQGKVNNLKVFIP
jgi:hypothetical protein